MDIEVEDIVVELWAKQLGSVVAAELAENDGGRNGELWRGEWRV